MHINLHFNYLHFQHNIIELYDYNFYLYIILYTWFRRVLYTNVCISNACTLHIIGNKCIIVVLLLIHSDLAAVSSNQVMPFCDVSGGTSPRRHTFMKRLMKIM